MDPEDKLYVVTKVCDVMCRHYIFNFPNQLCLLVVFVDNDDCFHNTFACVCFLSGSRACSSREGGKCWKWKFLWLSNPPAEVMKSLQTYVALSESTVLAISN